MLLTHNQTRRLKKNGFHIILKLLMWATLNQTQQAHSDKIDMLFSGSSAYWNHYSVLGIGTGTR